MLVPASSGPEPAGPPRSPVHRAIQRVLAAACLAAAGALAASCNIIINAGDYRVGTECPTGDCDKCGGFDFAVPQCGACVESKCCAEADACRADPSCAALFDCETACKTNDAACRNACRAAHPVGDNAAAHALEACMTTSAQCGAACSTCGGLADWQAKDCASCVLEKCCTQARACADDDICSERQLCYRACTYPTCSIDCELAFAANTLLPQQGETIATFDKCTNVACNAECAYGAQWGCVGKFAWPEPTGGTVKLTFDAFHFLSGAPFEGANIKVCAGNDITCAEGIDKQVHTTDAKGVAAIDLPSGFDGYFEITSPDAMSTLIFIAWPITSDQHYSVGLDPYEVYTNLVQQGGGMAKDDLGALFVFTYDCLLRPAPNVMLSVDLESEDPLGSTAHFYFLGDKPVSAADATTPTGIGGFANIVPNKTVTLKAQLKREGTSPLDLAALPVYVRPKTLTYVSLPPTP